MSEAFAAKVHERFPEVEVFPAREAAAQAPPTMPPAVTPGGEAPKAAPVRRPAHEQPPTYLTAGVVVPVERLLEVCRVLATDPTFGLAYLSFVSAIDRPEAGQFEVLYHLYSHTSHEELVLKVRIPRDQPTIPSVTRIWGGANWHEREAYDLFGITFSGHPDLRRIMMTDDWIGHPLRKDYVYQDPPWLVEAAKQRQSEIKGLGLGERA
jgi:NADH/F420H2 dehydrogenase subunit C